MGDRVKEEAEGWGYSNPSAVSVWVKSPYLRGGGGGKEWNEGGEGGKSRRMQRE